MNAPGRPSALSQKALTHRERLWIVVGALLPVFMGSMDQTVTASVLPTIGRDLGDVSHLAWAPTANLLTVTAMTPLYGKISDIIGRRSTLFWSISIFMLGSLVSALSPSMTIFILGRAAQGLGSGGLTTVAMTVLGDIAPPKERARYYTYFSIVYITSGAVGPLWGGYAAQHFGYAAIFWANIPMGLVALALVATLLKRLPRHDRPHKLDILGALLLAGASSTWIFVLNAGGHDFAWESLEIIGASLLSIICWIAFGVRLWTAPEPFIPLGILRSKIALCACVSNGVGWAGVVGLNIYLPLYLQAVAGYSPTGSGAAMMMLMATVNGGALIGAQIAGRMRHYKWPGSVALLLACAACLWLAWRARHVGAWEFQAILFCIGMGFGPSAPISTVALQNSIKLSELGVASGVTSFIRSITSTGLVAAFGALVLGGARAGAGPILGDPDAAAGKFAIIFLAAAGVFAVSLFAFAFMEERPLQSERAPG